MSCLARTLGGLGILVVLAAGPVGAAAEPGTGRLRAASISQWVVEQHRGPSSLLGRSGALAAEFGTALEQGVVDRMVFWWQRGALERRWLVQKPVRVLPAGEAAALGGRGDFALGAVRAPSGRAAFTEIEIRALTGAAADVLVLEIGWDRETIRQVLDTLLLAPPAARLTELPLLRRALVPADGVSILTAPFGRPVEVAGAAGLFRGAAGVEFLVVRSEVAVVENGAVTASGPADRATSNVGDWREGDRVLVRVGWPRLRAGIPAIVLGWKDRTDKSDPDMEFPRTGLRVPRFP